MAAQRMPIPTDTFWNIKTLNRVFLVSSLALLIVTVWTIFQDYGMIGANWRDNQRQARTWEAALVSEKIERDLTPEKQRQLDELQKQIDSLQTDLESRNEQYKKLQARVKQLESDRDTRDFTLKTDKANIGVEQAHL